MSEAIPIVNIGPVKVRSVPSGDKGGGRMDGSDSSTFGRPFSRADSGSEIPEFVTSLMSSVGVRNAVELAAIAAALRMFRILANARTLLCN